MVFRPEFFETHGVAVAENHVGGCWRYLFRASVTAILAPSFGTACYFTYGLARRRSRVFTRDSCGAPTEW